MAPWLGALAALADDWSSVSNTLMAAPPSLTPVPMDLTPSDLCAYQVLYDAQTYMYAKYSYKLTNLWSCINGVEHLLLLHRTRAKFHMIVHNDLTQEI